MSCSVCTGRIVSSAHGVVPSTGRQFMLAAVRFTLQSRVTMSVSITMRLLLGWNMDESVPWFNKTVTCIVTLGVTVYWVHNTQCCDLTLGSCSSLSNKYLGILDHPSAVVVENFQTGISLSLNLTSNCGIKRSIKFWFCHNRVSVNDKRLNFPLNSTFKQIFNHRSSLSLLHYFMHQNMGEEHSENFSIIERKNVSVKSRYFISLMSMNDSTVWILL